MARQKKNPLMTVVWPEVSRINSYAIFMGYLLMGVRALGFLVFTWTTVVLLGGFVSMPQKKEFWCLTVITLVQTASWEKAGDIGNSLKGSLAAVVAAVLRPLRKDTNTSVSSSKIKEPSIAREVVALVISVVHVLVLGIVLCPLAVLYVFGLDLSVGISSWRLMQHDYGNVDGGANLELALNVLYSLAVAQGVVYGYKTIYDLVARTGLEEVVVNHYSLEIDLVLDYLEETVAGCRKDPSFAGGRNLVTYAVDLLMESKSRHDYISGVLILGKIHGSEQQDLLEQLLTGSASFSHVVQRLLETFGPRSPYSIEIMVRAAGIVANVAGSIRLEQFPAEGFMMIKCIPSLLDTFEEYSWRPERQRNLPEDKKYERGYLDIDKITIPAAADSKTQGYKGLVVQGLCILQGLAVNEENCRVISSSEGLLSKTMAPLISDRLHGDHHDEWSSIATESLEFMKRLIATLGGTETTKMRSEISSNIQAIFRTLGCHKCQVLLKIHAAQVLLQLSPDTPPSIVPGRSSSIIFALILLDIFLLPDYQFDRMRGSTHLAKKSSDIARLAGEKMQAMIPSKTKAMIPSVGYVIGSLAGTVAGAENNAYRIHAATILAHLRAYYSKDDENLKELKKAMANVMPESTTVVTLKSELPLLVPHVLKEIVHWLTTEEVQVVTEANNGGKVLLTEEGLDLEQGGVPHDNDNGQDSRSTSHQQKVEQHHGIQLQEALVDLCKMISFRWIDKDQDLTRQFNVIAAEICLGQGMPHKTFRELVEEARDKLREEKRASRLAAVRTS